MQPAARPPVSKLVRPTDFGSSRDGVLGHCSCEVAAKSNGIALPRPAGYVGD